MTGLMIKNRAYIEDLFGEVVEPGEVKIPRRGSREYLAHLNTLPLPDGCVFWALAPLVEGLPPRVEAIWCFDPRGRERYLLVDVRTGQQHIEEAR